MPKKRRTSWMICYDIADERRLQVVHRLVSGCGVRVQYSVYYMLATEEGIDALMGRLGEIIDHREDDIRVYPLPDNPSAYSLGHDPIAGAILKTGAGGIYLVTEGDDTA